MARSKAAWRAALGCIALAAAPALPGAAAEAVAKGPELVSRASGAKGSKANGESYRPSISAGGRFVVFESRATNLAPADTDDRIDVYVRDLARRETILVSRASGAGGEKGNGDSAGPSISSDGRFVAFASTATNLVPGAEQPGFHVYVRDLVAETTIRVDRASGADGAFADNESGHPDISPDGRYVAFDSAAGNLDPADADQGVDVYLRDLATASTALVSHRGPEVAGENFALAAVGAGADRIAYRTNTIVPGRLFARDRLAAATTSFGPTDDILGPPAISADGRRIALTQKATPGARLGDRVRVWEPRTGQRITASTELAPWGRFEPGSSSDPSISDDGRYAVFAVQHGDRRSGFRVGAVIRDLRKGTSTNVRAAVSRRSTKHPPYVPLFPTLSRGADRLAFLTQAHNRPAGDRDGLSDVYVMRSP